VFWVFQVQILI